jgi:hypothetical protein
MTRFKLLLAPLIAVAVLSTPAAAARRSHVTPRYLAYDAYASVPPRAQYRYVDGPIGVRAPPIRMLAPAPTAGGGCDVGDNPRVC